MDFDIVQFLRSCVLWPAKIKSGRMVPTSHSSQITATATPARPDTHSGSDGSSDGDDDSAAPFLARRPSGDGRPPRHRCPPPHPRDVDLPRRAPVRRQWHCRSHVRSRMMGRESRQVSDFWTGFIFEFTASLTLFSLYLFSKLQVKCLGRRKWFV